MDDRQLQDSVITHLQQAHAMERSLQAELRTLAAEVEVAAISTLLRAHCEETRAHGDRLEARLEELGAGASTRLLAQSYTAAFPKLVIDRVRPNDACATLRDAIAAEAGEIASYLLLEAEAVRAGDESTAVLAAELRAQERATRDELMTYWHQAVEADVSSRTSPNGHPSRTHIAHDLLLDHQQDIQALERNAVIMLTTVLATVDDELARDRVSDHRHTTSRHADTVVDRLRELGSRPSLRKQAQGYAFAAVKGPINLVRRERAAKDLRDMYVVEHLELAAYAHLRALAEHCGDERTAQLAESPACDETAMATWLEHEAGRFLLETLEAKG
jgi:ferritin-like metal-binding protein YciE